MKRLISAKSYSGEEEIFFSLFSSNIFVMKLVWDLTEVSFILNTHFIFPSYPLVLEEDQILDFHLHIFKESSRFRV